MELLRGDGEKMMVKKEGRRGGEGWMQVGGKPVLIFCILLVALVIAWLCVGELRVILDISYIHYK